MKKGVSLISLIITIIVIIILASIAIFSATGSVEQSQMIKKQSEFEEVTTFIRSISSRAEAGLLDLDLTEATVATGENLNSMYCESGELTAEEVQRINSINISDTSNKYKYHYIEGKYIENANIPGLENIATDSNFTFPKKVENNYIINFYTGTVIARIAPDKTLVHGKILSGGTI